MFLFPFFLLLCDVIRLSNTSCGEWIV